MTPSLDAATKNPAEPSLLRLQVPVDLISQSLDRFLLAHVPISAQFLWLVHLGLAVMLTLVLAWGLGLLCRRLARIAARRSRLLTSKLLDLLAPNLRWVVLLAGFADALDDAWPAKHGPLHWVSGTLFVIAALIGTRAFVHLSRLALENVLMPMVQHDETGPSAARPGTTSSALLPLVSRIVAMLLWLSGLIIVLDHFGQNVSSVVAALGVTSLAIGLASQQALSNIIAGFVLAADHPFRVGDRIRIPAGDTGEVLEIGMRATLLRLYDDTTLVIPNAELVSSRLLNQSTERAVRAEVRLVLPGIVDLDRLLPLLEADLASAPTISTEPCHRRIVVLSVGEKLDLSIIAWLPRGSQVTEFEERFRRTALRRIHAVLPPALLAGTSAGRGTAAT